MESKYILGIHDPGGEHLLDPGGWIVFTEALGTDPNDQSSRSYTQWSSKWGTIVRLNNGYGSVGTIPVFSEQNDYIKRVQNFVRNSSGNQHWIIGNEMNHPQEWPYNNPIYPQQYIQLFNWLYSVIKNTPGHENDVVLVGAPAPWNNSVPYEGNRIGDWVQYWLDILDGVNSVDALCLHTYTHGSNPDLISSSSTMDPPFEDRFYHFRAIEDFLRDAPDLPVYITEANQNQPWIASNWIETAMQYIVNHNEKGRHIIRCFAVYRWPTFDNKSISDKPLIQDEIRRVAAMGIKWPIAIPKPPPQKEDLLQEIVREANSQPEIVADRFLDRMIQDKFVPKKYPAQSGNLVAQVAGNSAEDRVYYTDSSGRIRWVRIGAEDIRILHPVKNPAFRDRITQIYGVNAANYPTNGHAGVDIGLVTGSELVSPMDGVAVEVIDQGSGGYGRYIKIEADAGWGHALLGHMSQFLVQQGQAVKAGQVIGLSGNTGNSTGPHVHIAMRIYPAPRNDGMNGWDDPLPYLEYASDNQDKIDPPPVATRQAVGIDISSHQGFIDWNSIDVSELDFVIQRASIANYLIDEKFDEYWNGIESLKSRNPNLIHMVYMVTAPYTSSGIELNIDQHVNTFVNLMGNRKPDMPICVDVELNRGATPNKQESLVLGVCDRLKGLGFGDCIIYTGAWFWNPRLPRNSVWAQRFPLWVASYSENVVLPTDWTNWTIWQYTSSARISGITGNVDRNRANLSVERMIDWSRQYKRGELK